jgi:HEPN domain-containing protein
MDVEKHVNYWREGAMKAYRSVPHSLECGFVTEALFWTHLAVEKALKAHVTKATCAVPPRTHNLIRLAARAGIELDDAQKTLCEVLTRYQGMGRYPDVEYEAEPELAAARELIQQSEIMWQWLLKQLEA